MNPDQRFQETGKRLVKVVDQVVEFLMNWRKDIRGPHPEEALRFALLMLISSIRDFVVFSETTMYQNFTGLRPNELPSILNEFFQRMVARP